MPLYDILAWKFGEALFGVGWTVMERDGVQEITQWDDVVMGRSKPATDEMRGWWLDAEKWKKRGEFAATADRDYEAILFPEGRFTRLEKDEIIEKKAVISAGGPNRLTNLEGTASAKIDTLRQKRRDKFKAVNDITQGATETVEDAVARVRAVLW